MAGFGAEQRGVGGGGARSSWQTRRTLKVVVLVGIALVLMASSNSVGAPKYSDWSAPTNLGPIVNSASIDAGPAISKDGLSLYFHSTRPGGFGLNDIWVSQRASEDDPWGPPVNVGPAINTEFTDAVPGFSRDGHWMFFNRLGGPGSFGGFDVWASYREHVHDDFAWETAVNLGPEINTEFLDAGPGYFENDDVGVPLLFFGSTRPGGLGGYDIYVSAQLPDGSWGTPASVTELNSPAPDQRPSIRSDGLELFFHSGRPGGFGGSDVWVSTRESTSDPWTTPVNLGAGVNSPQVEQQAYIASDRQTLYFASDRPGGLGDFDLYVTTRMRQGGT